MRDFLSVFTITLLVFLLSMPFLLKACDREFDYQQAKVAQWQLDNQSEKPFKDFNE